MELYKDNGKEHGSYYIDLYSIFSWTKHRRTFEITLVRLKCNGGSGEPPGASARHLDPSNAFSSVGIAGLEQKSYPPHTS